MARWGGFSRAVRVLGTAYDAGMSSWLTGPHPVFVDLSVG